MKTKHISKFLFSKAQYITIDRYGREIILEIDYWNNTYTIPEEVTDKALMKELKNIAKDLLDRKHRKNFAEIEV